MHGSPRHAWETATQQGRGEKNKPCRKDSSTKKHDYSAISSQICIDLELSFPINSIPLPPFCRLIFPCVWGRSIKDTRCNSILWRKDNKLDFFFLYCCYVRTRLPQMFFSPFNAYILNRTHLTRQVYFQQFPHKTGISIGLGLLWCRLCSELGLHALCPQRTKTYLYLLFFFLNTNIFLFA